MEMPIGLSRIRQSGQSALGLVALTPFSRASSATKRRDPFVRASWTYAAQRGGCGLRDAAPNASDHDAMATFMTGVRNGFVKGPRRW
ncbi:MAG TPA: hypothetical protein DEA50_13960 [Parvularcula sp.]|nr:hypothetical protein [Parvularcula sp.]